MSPGKGNAGRRGMARMGENRHRRAGGSGAGAGVRRVPGEESPPEIP
ncbi:MAG: hypothetical protein IMW96_05615 [Thermoanaerobacteraceae bacterium]|nr:hypothetical protein [Thermoanaerobacteraceae bacterium]